MLDEADRRGGINIGAMMQSATMPAAEADSPSLSWLSRLAPAPDATMRALDWVRFGQLLRAELGWDDTYPDLPDFPEARNVP